MSRKQFLAELSQYLTFVSPEQREEIISYYDAMLENAGLKGEAALLQEIGTPMTVAISLKRRLEANEPLLPEISDKIDTPYFVKFRRRDVKQVDDGKKVEGHTTEKVLKTKIVSEATEPEASPETEKAAEVAEASPEAEKAAEPDVAEASPEADKAAESDVAEASPEAEKAAEADVAEASSEAEKAAESDVAEASSDAEKAAESNTAEAALETDETADNKAKSKTEESKEHTDTPETEKAEKPKNSSHAAATANTPIDTIETADKPPMTFGRVMTAIGIGIASIVIVAFFTLITAIGGIIISSAVDIIISGFDGVSYLSDQLMIFAGGALVMGLGILLAWFAIWAAIRLIIGMIRSFNRTPAPDKSVLKSFWKIVWIIILVLVSIAIICGGVSLCLGGNPSILGDNEAFSKMPSKLNPTAFVNFFKNSGLLG